jgi:hypothetical protein
MSDFLSEKVIEDILSADKSILADMLSLQPSGLSLIARQKKLTSGRLDLLYLYENELLLIELKAVAFYDDIIPQINGYFQDLEELREQRKLIDAKIRKIILVTRYTPRDISKCNNEGIQLLSYEPELVLSRYYQNFKELSYFLKIQSGDYGVVRLGLIKSTLALLYEGRNLTDICDLEERSKKTIKNRLAVAIQLGLVTKYKKEYFLTEFGNEFVNVGKINASDRLNEGQIELLSNFVVDNPFYSSITCTVLTFLEAVFVLAKNTYPVPREVVQDYFVKSVGKTRTWKTDRARKTASYIFSNYACELELLANVNNHFYVAPKGIQAILVLQLNRSIKLIESQK